MRLSKPCWARSLDAEYIARSLDKCFNAGHGQWRVICPVHNGKSSNLYIKDGGGNKVLLHCFHGCANTEIIEALKQRGLWPEKKTTSPFKRYSRGELFELYLFLDIYKNSRNRPDLPGVTQQDHLKALEVKKLLRVNRFGRKQALEFMRK
jgi:hypothetical protein